MKGFFTKFKGAAVLFAAIFLFAGCAQKGKEHVLNDVTYYLVMQSMLFNPSAYLQDTFVLECFVYEIEDVQTGEVFTCGVRKCPSNIGCRCGNDSVLGFRLLFDGDIPPARNQTANDSDKTWIRVSGKLAGTELTGVDVYRYDAEGNPTNTIETIYFCSLEASSLEEIDGSELSYYVS